MEQEHDVPDTDSTERMHELSAECWCGPTVEIVEAKVVHK